MPTIRFKARTLEALKPTPNAQIDYFDKSLPGFHMRISPRGRKTFGVMYGSPVWSELLTPING